MWGIGIPGAFILKIDNGYTTGASRAGRKCTTCILVVCEISPPSDDPVQEYLCHLCRCARGLPQDISAQASAQVLSLNIINMNKF